MKAPVKQRNPIGNPDGFSLIELLISIALSMFILLTTAGMFVSAKAVQTTQFAASSAQEAARYALNNIARSVRQAGFISFENDAAPVIVSENMSPSIVGLDDATLKATSPGIENPAKSTNYSSDVLAVRFFGSGLAKADNSILNCAGFGVAAPSTQASAETERAWSIYYVANDSRGFPNLYCKYKNQNFTAQPVARGVEAFQVLYRIDTGNDPRSVTSQFLSASEINALDDSISVAQRNRTSNWKKVTAVKIALMIRGESNEPENLGPAVYKLFGENYSQTGSDADRGTQILQKDIPPEQRRRLRKIVGATIQLRNSVR